jgi:CRP/FNR family transcriptional regulator
LLSALRSCHFLRSLDEETLLLIRKTAKRVIQPKNTVIFNETERCRGFYIVESGAVKLYKESAEAKEHVLYVAMPGDCFGEAALFLGTGYPASAAAVKDSALILLSKDEFMTLLLKKPEVSLKLMASMATWAHRLTNSIESLTLKDAASRFADYILSRMPENPQDGVVVELGIPKQVLASHLGMTGETLSRLLARYEEDGLIEVQGRRIKIISIEDMEETSGTRQGAWW